MSLSGRNTKRNMPNPVTCPCQHCNGKLEFDPATLSEENRKITCPHCSLETILFVPPPPDAKMETVLSVAPRPPSALPSAKNEPKLLSVPPPSAGNPAKPDKGVRALLLLIAVCAVLIALELKPKATIRYEYKIEVVSKNEAGDLNYTRPLDFTGDHPLDDAGEKGWELVAALPQIHDVLLIYKRPEH
jgi:DNA-directed RNA polymerase subunit RPC12/RpoP